MHGIGLSENKFPDMEKEYFPIFPGIFIFVVERKPE